MDLKELGREGVEWIHRPHGRLHWRPFGNAIMHLRLP